MKNLETKLEDDITKKNELLILEALKRIGVIDRRFLYTGTSVKNSEKVNGGKNYRKRYSIFAFSKEELEYQAQEIEHVNVDHYNTLFEYLTENPHSCTVIVWRKESFEKVNLIDYKYKFKNPSNIIEAVEAIVKVDLCLHRL